MWKFELIKEMAFKNSSKAVPFFHKLSGGKEEHASFVKPNRINKWNGNRLKQFLNV